MEWVVALLVGILVGGSGLFFFLKMTSNKTILNAQKDAKNIITAAEKEVDTLKKEKLIEAQEEIYEQKQKLEQEYEKKRSQLSHTERELDQKEIDIDRKGEFISKKEKEVLSLEMQLKDKENYVGDYKFLDFARDMSHHGPLTNRNTAEFFFEKYSKIIHFRV